MSMLRDIPEMVRREMCEGCAFRPGSPANLNQITMLKARLCVMSGEPFLCHANLDENQEPTDGVLALCRGFHDAFENRLEKGVETPEWRRGLYLVLNEAIAEIEQNTNLRGEAQIEFINERVREWLKRETPNDAAGGAR